MNRAREKLPQIGLWDAEVSNPTHDALCTWALDHADRILRIVHHEQFDLDWRETDIHASHGYPDAALTAAIEAFKATTPRPNPRISRRLLEHVLYRESGYKSTQIVGYADVVLAVEVPVIYASKGKHPDYAVSVELQWHRATELAILIEAKTTMPTLGELMRQLNLYRTAFDRRAIVVLSPDDRHASRLEEQGIHFLRYPAD